jgi:uncharacterized protein involved in outer membrane biogenesis
MIRVGRIKISADLTSLWSRPVRVRDVEIDGVSVLLEADAEGRGNWKLGRRSAPDSPPKASTPAGPLVVFDRAVIRNSRLIYRARRDAPGVTFGVDHLDARLEPATGMIDLDATGRFNAAPWDITGRLGSLDRLYELRDVEHDVTGHIGRAKVSLEGRIRDPLALGDPNVEVVIEGPDVAEALATLGLRSPLSGPFELRGRMSPHAEGVALDLTAGLAGVHASSRGHVTALLKPDSLDAEIEASGPDATVVGSWVGIKGLPHRPFTVAGHVRREGPMLSLDDVKIRVGRTSIAVSGPLGEMPRCIGANLAVAATGADLSDMSALARLRLPAVPFDVRGRFLRRSDGLALDGADIRVKDVIIRAGGTIGEPPRLGNLDMTFEASGPDLSLFSDIAMVDLPRVPFSLRGHVARRLAAFDLDNFEGRIGDNTVLARGSLVPALHLVGTDFSVRVTGPDLGSVASWAGVRSLPAEPYEVSGRVRFSQDGYQLDGVEASVGRVAAAVDGHLGTLPALDGTALEGRAHGPALSDLAAWGVPNRLPADAFAVSGQLRIDNGVYHLDRVAASVGSDRVGVDGTLGSPPDLSAIDIGFEASGPRLADLSRFFVRADGEPLKRIPAEPYTVCGRLRRDLAGIELREVNAKIGNADILLDGVVGSGQKLLGTDMRFEVEAPDTSLPSALIGATLPDGPLDVRGRIERGDSGFRLDGVTASIGETQAEISGMLGEPPKLAGTDLEFSIAGEDLAETLGPITGLSPLPSASFLVEAQVEGSIEQFASRCFAARLGESDLEGNVSVRLQGRPFIEADLRSKHLGLTQIFDGFLGEPAAEPAPPKPNEKTPRKHERFIPHDPLTLGALRSLDAKIRLTMEQLVVPAVALHDVTIDVDLRDGAFRSKRIEGTGTHGGRATASLGVEPVEEGYRVVAEGRIEGGRLYSPKGGDVPEQAPTVDIEFEMQGVGRSLHDIAASSGGHALITVGSGRLPSTASDFVTSGVLRGLLDALNPLRKSSPYTSIECGVVAAYVENGDAVVEPVAARTDKLTIIGKGKIDFDTEEIDLVWTLKPRKGVGISAGSIANPYVKLGGTLSSPALEVKTLKAVTSTGAAVATAGLTVLFRGFYDRITAEKKVCVEALEKAQRKAEERQRGKTP